jgi:acetyltransferase-like isoleucine patch superfamily enzyme
VKFVRRLIRVRFETIIEAILNKRLSSELSELREMVNSKVNQEGFEKYLGAFINEEVRVWGDVNKLHLDPTVQLANTLFNTSSGEIWLSEYSFTGHNVSIITGTHNGETFLRERQENFPTTGGDIRIGRGVWLGSNSIILGPCTIGDHAIIGAGCIVTGGSNIPRGGVVVGVPGRVIRILSNLPN